MLRGLALALLLANLAFFAWTRSAPDRSGPGDTASGAGADAAGARQVRPEVVQLLPPPGAAPASASPAAVTASASAAEAAPPASPEASSVSMAASASAAEPAASSASAAAAAPVVVAEAPPPPGTRCIEAGPFSSGELAAAETALAANAKAGRIARRWVEVPADAASAPVASASQHRLRIDAKPDEVALLESLPSGVLGKAFAPCAAR